MGNGNITGILQGKITIVKNIREINQNNLLVNFFCNHKTKWRDRQNGRPGNNTPKVIYSNRVENAYSGQNLPAIMDDTNQSKSTLA